MRFLRCTKILLTLFLGFNMICNTLADAPDSNTCALKDNSAWLAKHPGGHIYTFDDSIFLASPNEVSGETQELAYQITNFENEAMSVQLSGISNEEELLPDYTVSAKDDYYFRLFGKQYAIITPPEVGKVACVGVVM